MFISKDSSQKEKLSLASFNRMKQSWLLSRYLFLIIDNSILNVLGVFSHFGGYLEQSASVIILDMESDSDDSNTFRVFIESSLRNMADSLVGFTVIQRKGMENSMMDSVEYKGLKRLQWPGSESSDRRRQKFYKQLQLRLPKPVKLDERTPLLQNVQSAGIQLLDCSFLALLFIFQLKYGCQSVSHCLG